MSSNNVIPFPRSPLPITAEERVLVLVARYTMLEREAASASTTPDRRRRLTIILNEIDTVLAREALP